MSKERVRSSSLVVGALALVAAAAGFGGAQLAVAGGNAQLVSGAYPGVDPVEHERLRSRVAEIEQQLAHGSRAPLPSDRSQHLQRAPAPSADALGSLEERLGKLERDLAAIADKLEGSAAESRPPRPDAEQIAHAIRADQQAIVDPSSTIARKLEAWRQLRSRTNAYTDAVVREMVVLGLSSTDPEVRVDVWRQASGQSKHPELAVAMIKAVLSDPVVGVRRKAAETLLTGYIDRPDVVQALRALCDSDGDESLRLMVARVLEHKQKR